MDHYEPLEPIGSGSFGIIRKVRRISDGKILARKEIDFKYMNEKEKKQLVAEVNILRELKHPNIVRYYERVVDRENSLIYIVMEYCEGGDLGAVIKRCKRDKKHIPEDIIWNLLAQLLLALNECHHSPSHPTILHRDVKPENVFLDKALNLKLGDFGLSRMIGDPDVEFAKTFVGTPFYMSPELIQESQYNTKSDVWALGCLIHELCALEPPFQGKTQAALTLKIKTGRSGPLPNQYSPELQRLIRAMLTIQHPKRPSAQDCLSHSRIKLAIREHELATNILEFKKKDQDLKNRASALQEREARISQREQILAEKEARLRQLESRLMAGAHPNGNTSSYSSSPHIKQTPRQEYGKGPPLNKGEGQAYLPPPSGHLSVDEISDQLQKQLYVLESPWKGHRQTQLF